MQELISITTDAQGASVVSARELHGFLEVKTKFADWIKGRIIQYGLLEDTDYAEVASFSENSEKRGRPEVDYALTLDTAKQLSMVERNDKGKAARLYFINAEKTLRAIIERPAPLSTEQVLLQLVQQSNQLLAGQQEQLSQLRADVDHILQTGHRPAPVGPPRQSSQQLSLPGVQTPRRSRPGLNSLRHSINQRVTDYCGFHGATTQETYNYLYKRMYDVYSVNVYRLQRGPGESLLDALERYGHLDRVYSLIMAELNYVE